MISLDDVLGAQARISPVCVRTPCLPSESIGHATGARVWLKAENMQRTGSFKFRGAYHTLLSLDERDRAAGVCTVSSGNHAHALALSGRLLKTAVQVWMPDDAPDSKQGAVLRNGARLEAFGRYALSQDEVSARLRARPGSIFISAHDDPRVVAGAGTLAIEMFEDVPDLDTIVMPVGGGGGLAGVGIVARAMNPSCRVIGVEPLTSGAVGRSLRAGRPIAGSVPHTIADGQTVTAPGDLTLPIMLDVVDEVVTVSDDQIRTAMCFVRQNHGIVLEPSGATGIGALLSKAVRGRRIGVVMTGGNIDEARWRRIFAPVRSR